MTIKLILLLLGRLLFLIDVNGLLLEHIFRAQINFNWVVSYKSATIVQFFKYYLI